MPNDFNMHLSRSKPNQFVNCVTYSVEFWWSQGRASANWNEMRRDLWLKTLDAVDLSLSHWSTAAYRRVSLLPPARPFGF